MSTKKAAKQQVEETVEGDSEVVGNNNDSRLAMLNAINDQNDIDRTEDLVEYGEDGLVSKFVPTEDALPESLTPSDDDGVTEIELARMEAETVEEDEEAPPPVQKFKIKVNGKEMELTQEELISRAQKVEAADTYLAEAARIRKDAQNSPAKPPPTETAEAQRIEEMRALARAIQMGTEEEAIAAIGKLQSRPSVTQDDLMRTVDERLTFKDAVSKFESTYQDILSDPMLKSMALKKDQDLMAQNDTRDYWTRYQDIGNEIRAWRDNLVKANAPAAVPDTSKQTRKAAAAPAPKAANVKSAAPVDEDDSEESPAAVIAGIAKARGGPQWMRS